MADNGGNPGVVLKNIPDKINRSDRYIFYLHGLIVEEAGIRPHHPEHGWYEYEAILGALSEKGSVVISEVRKKGTDVIRYAEWVSSQIRELLLAGVPPERICVVGASKGGVIGAYISKMMGKEGINYVLLAGLFEKYLVDETLALTGNVLSIHDSSDTFSMTPEAYFKRSKKIGKHQSVVLNLGVGHGLIYKPRREWLEPAMAWINAE